MASSGYRHVPQCVGDRPDVLHRVRGEMDSFAGGLYASQQIVVAVFRSELRRVDHEYVVDIESTCMLKAHPNSNGPKQVGRRDHIGGEWIVLLTRRTAPLQAHVCNCRGRGHG